MKRRFFITSALLFPALMAMSAGYQLNLQGLRQIAMGGGGTAMPWDASTIFYNPGGLSRLPGLQVYASGQFIMPHVQYLANGAGSNAVNAVDQIFSTFNFYLGGTILKSKRLGVGIGVYTPFGSGLKWDDNWTGRYVTQEIMLKTVFFQPTVSYRLNDMISIGAGFVYSTGSVTLREAIPAQNATGADGTAKLTGKAHGTGYNVGINLKASDRLQFGITYRSQVDMDVTDGTAEFTVPAAVRDSFPSSSFKSSLPLPQILSLGVAYKPLERFTVQLDLSLAGWKAYDVLSFDYAQNTTSLQDTHAPRHYRNKLTTRLGAHYQATDALAIMLGGAYDPTPVQDNYVSPDLPDANRLVLSGGLTLKLVKHLTLMGAVEYVTSEKRSSNYAEANFSGTYQTKAITPCIGLTYDF